MSAAWLTRLPERGLGGRIKRRPERHDQILTVAAVLFNRQGFKNTSMEDIAKEVGFTIPAIYRHFRNKQEILDTAVVWIMRRLSERYFVRGSTSPDAAARLEALLDELLDATLESGDFVGLLVHEINEVSPSAREYLLGLRREYLDRWHRVIREAIPSLSKRSVDLHAYLITSLLASVASYHQSRPEDFRTELKQISLDLLFSDYANNPTKSL